MAAPARHSTARHFPYGAHEPYAPEELSPGERIGAPLARTGGRALLRGGVVILIVLGGGWALLGHQPNWTSFAWRGWPAAETAAVSPPMDRKLPGSVERAAPAEATPAPTTKPAALDKSSSTLHPAPSSKTAALPSLAAKSAPPPLATAAPPLAAAGVDAPPAPPLPPPTADPADPYQMRAEAVGLHPGLSRVLLASLSPTDYRNAGIAIQTAVAETPDNAAFVWPRQRKPELALFQVRFVPGAAPDCRRYVVTITKDRWVTTALPMERCGSQPGRPRRE